jgi:hypothetical protein
MSSAAYVDFYDIIPPKCEHDPYQKDCVACAVRVLNMYLPATMRLSVESKPGFYQAQASDRDGFFRVVANGLTPAEALINLRNPLALIAFMGKSNEGDER